MNDNSMLSTAYPGMTDFSKDLIACYDDGDHPVVWLRKGLPVDQWTDCGNTLGRTVLYAPDLTLERRTKLLSDAVRWHAWAGLQLLDSGEITCEVNQDWPPIWSCQVFALALVDIERRTEEKIRQATEGEKI